MPFNNRQVSEKITVIIVLSLQHHCNIFSVCSVDVDSLQSIPKPVSTNL